LGDLLFGISSGIHVKRRKCQNDQKASINPS